VTELDESNRQFIDAWELFARRAAHGTIEERGGIAVAFSGVAMPLMNMVFLTTPVVDIADLSQRARLAADAGAASGRPWMCTLCEDWLPPGVQAAAAAAMAAIGLAAASTATGMVAESLAPPRRTAPPGLAIRPVDAEPARRHVAELNSAAYQLPTEWGYEAMTRRELFATDVWGDVGYLGDTPVSTSTTALLDGRLYVMMVATAAGEMNKGYAEAVIRHSLARAIAATGVRRTVLHATPAGQPLYASMGYRPTSRYTMYMAGEAHA
jgi:hypothetical protein